MVNHHVDTNAKLRLNHEWNRARPQPPCVVEESLLKKIRAVLAAGDFYYLATF